jgi:hypothetical protein
MESDTECGAGVPAESEMDCREGGESGWLTCFCCIIPSNAAAVAGFIPEASILAELTE